MTNSSDKSPKVALFYDWLNQWGGAERVLLDLLKLYPNAPVYTLVHDPSNTTWLPKDTKIIPSFINKLPNAKNNPIYYTPLYPLALEQFDFSQYDIVISTTSTVGHCLLTPPQTKFVCYFHNINRYVYQNQPQLFKPILKKYKKIDKIFSRRPDHVLCNSKTVQKRIKNVYNLDAKIINPGINTDFFVPSPKPQREYFLIAGRIVAHKNIEIAINTCIEAKVKLKIVGTGRLEKHYKNKYQSVEFTGKVTDQQLLSYYQNCIALLYPQVEDFGLTAIEAQACGKPVIALNSGGATETVIDQKTGILYNHLNPKTLSQFNPSKYKSADCVKNASQFSSDIFMLHFKKFIDSIC